MITPHRFACSLGYGIAGVAEAPDLNAGLLQILSETIMVANAMNLYVEALLVAAVKSNIPAKPPQSIAMRVDDSCLPSFRFSDV